MIKQPQIVCLISCFLLLLGGSNRVVRAASIDLIQLPTTTHADFGGINPQFAYDGDFTTGFSGSAGPGNNGGHGGTITSEHYFALPSEIDSIVFRMISHSYSTGTNTRTHEGQYLVEYLSAGTWLTVPGSFNAFSAGDGDSAIDSGVVTLTGLNLQASGLRASVHFFGNASGNDGNAGGDGHLYEIQAMSLVPEPSTFSLAAVGLLGMGCWKRRRVGVWRRR